MSAVIRREITIANGASESDEVDIFQDSYLYAIVTPASMEGGALAFEGSADFGETFVPVVDEVNQRITVTIDANAAMRAAPAELEGLTHLIVATVNSPANLTAVNQTGDAVLTLVLSPRR